MSRYSRQRVNSPGKPVQVIQRRNCSEQDEQNIINTCQQELKKTQDNSSLQTSLSIQLAKSLRRNVSLSIQNSADLAEVIKSTYCSEEQNPSPFLELKSGDKQIRVWVTEAHYNLPNREWRLARQSEQDKNIRVIRQEEQ